MIEERLIFKGEAVYKFERMFSRDIVLQMALFPVKKLTKNSPVIMTCNISIDESLMKHPDVKSQADFDKFLNTHKLHAFAGIRLFDTMISLPPGFYANKNINNAAICRKISQVSDITVVTKGSYKDSAGNNRQADLICRVKDNAIVYSIVTADCKPDEPKHTLAEIRFTIEGQTAKVNNNQKYKNNNGGKKFTKKPNFKLNNNHHNNYHKR